MEDISILLKPDIFNLLGLGHFNIAITKTKKTKKNLLVASQVSAFK